MVGVPVPNATHESTSATLGTVIRSQREKKGWSIERLASKVRITKSKLSDLELGKRRVSVDEFVKLASALGLPVPDLLIAKERPPGFDVASKLLEVADSLVQSSPATWTKSASEFNEYSSLVSAIATYRDFVRRQVICFQTLDLDREPTEQVDSKIVEECTKIFHEPLNRISTDSYPRAWLQHELGKLWLLFGNLAALGRISGDWQRFFDFAESAFSESLRIKGVHPMRPQHVLATELKQVEVKLDRIYWAQKKGVAASDRAQNLTQIDTEIELIRQKYEAVDPDSAACKHGVAHCLFMQARVKYLHGKLAPNAHDAVAAFRAADDLCERSKTTKLALGDADGVVWADALLAKCALRRLLLDESNSDAEQTTIDRYFETLTAVNPLSLEDLRSLCALTTVYRDLVEGGAMKPESCKAWVTGVLRRINPSPA